ncbi:MAG: hypothetical protein QOK47_1666 [Actinomycetota bacterium]|jgi:hypothetical protein|nr:hypothetical protein [Actinomycetota bacterium]
MRKLWVAVLFVSALVPPVLAFASHQNLQDRNDARGPLDIAEVKMSGDVRFPRWTTFTWKKWTAAHIWDRGFLLVEFDTLGNSRFDYYAMVRSDGERLLASLHRDYRKKDDRRVARLHLARPGKSSVRIRVPLDKMEFEEELHYRWKAQTMWTGSHCTAVCFDRAPDKGAVEEPRSAPTPTPTPTITITPTPTDV